MSEGKPKFRKGTGDVQFHPVPFLFTKSPHRNIVLVGDDSAQLAFVEQLTGLTCETKEAVGDDDLLGKDGVLYRVLAPQSLNVSPALRNRTGIYSLAPITSGSIAANALVKVAAELMETKLDRDTLDAVSRLVGRGFERKEIADLRVGLWRAFWWLSGELPPYRWHEPWETPDLHQWMPPGVDMGYRLGTLFKTLKTYVLLQLGQEKEAKALGLSPSKQAYLKTLHLRPVKVRASLLELSRWKHFGTDPKIVALALTRVWGS